MFTKQIDRVAIVGSTHGNELLGIYLVKKYQLDPELVKRTTFETITFLANPRAFKLGTRYVDKDLNRCFHKEDLANSKLNSYEDLRAKEINNFYSDNLDFLIDIHSTTSNAGIMIILEKGFEKDPLILNLSAYLVQVNPFVRLFCWSKTQPKNRLRSVARKSIAVEIGAIAHGTLNAEYFQQTEQLIQNILDFLNCYNQKLAIPIISDIEVFEGQQLRDYPRDRHGELTAMIHPELEDYKALNFGDPIFMTFEGQTIAYQNTSTVYPVFIGEASYQKKKIAFVLCSKQIIQTRVDYFAEDRL